MRTVPIRKLITALLTATAVLWTGMAPASVITLSDPVLAALGPAGDGASITRDLDNQLDWLDWNLTTSYSYDTVHAQLLAEDGLLAGWRFATALDFLALGRAAGVPDNYVDGFVAGAPAAELVALAEALGITEAGSGSAFAVFGEPGTQPDTLRLGGITLHTMVGGGRGRSGPSAIFGAPNDPETWMAQNWSSYKVNSSVGMALVRSSVHIPEPGMLMLFAMGVLSLLVARPTEWTPDSR